MCIARIFRGKRMQRRGMHTTSQLPTIADELALESPLPRQRSCTRSFHFAAFYETQALPLIREKTLMSLPSGSRSDIDRLPRG